MARRPCGLSQTRDVQAAAILALSFGAGAIPFSYLAGRRSRGVDLRRVGTGTGSGTSLYRVAGFGPLAAAGGLEVAKGAGRPAGAPPPRPPPAAAGGGGGVAVAGHNWSPFLRGAGGRGISPALGALLVVAWPGAVLLLAGMILGKVFGETAVGALVAEIALAPVLALTHGAVGALAGISVAVPLRGKRVAGNAPAPPPRAQTYRNRILFDRDQRVASDPL